MTEEELREQVGQMVCNVERGRCTTHAAIDAIMAAFASFQHDDNQGRGHHAVGDKIIGSLVEAIQLERGIAGGFVCPECHRSLSYRDGSIGCPHCDAGDSVAAATAYPLYGQTAPRPLATDCGKPCERCHDVTNYYLEGEDEEA